MKSESLYDKKTYRSIVILLAISLIIFLTGYLMVNYEWGIDIGIRPLLIKTGCFSILVACEIACLSIWLLIATFAFFSSFERFYDTESVEDLSAVFNIKGVSILFLFGFLCCFGYDIYHINKLAEISCSLLQLSLCVDFAWIISLVAHYNQSDNNRFVDPKTNDKRKYNRASKETHLLCFFMLMFLTLISKTVCYEGTKIIINMKAGNDQNYIQNIADSVWNAYMDAKSGRISCDNWADTYDELCSGLYLSSWNNPKNEIEKQIMDSCKNDIESIRFSCGTPEIFIQIKDNYVYAELMNPNGKISEYAQNRLKALKAFDDTPQILFLYHVYNEDKSCEDYNLVIDRYGNIYEIIDDAITGNDFEQLIDALTETKSYIHIYPYPSAAVSEKNETVSENIHMFRKGVVDLFDLNKYYKYYLLNININTLYLTDGTHIPDLSDIYTVEIYAFRYDAQMNTILDLIYLKDREGCYKNKSQGITTVNSWIMLNISDVLEYSPHSPYNF